MRLVWIWYAFRLRLGGVWYAFKLRLTRSHRRKAWEAGFGQSNTDTCCRKFVRITAVCGIAQGAKRGDKKVGSVGTVTNSQKFHHFGRMPTDRLIPSVRAMRPQAKRIKRYLQRLIMFGVNFVMFGTNFVMFKVPTSESLTKRIKKFKIIRVWRLIHRFNRPLAKVRSF